jgi:hypothetical protein
LLQDPRVDPSVNAKQTIRLASAKGNLAIVNRILQDTNIDPSAEDNYVIRIASENGHLAVVERLLQHSRIKLHYSRVKSTPKSINTIQSAFMNHDKEIFKSLLSTINQSNKNRIKNRLPPEELTRWCQWCK